MSEISVFAIFYDLRGMFKVKFLRVPTMVAAHLKLRKFQFSEDNFRLHEANTETFFF
jgi:hypothetical protein